MVLLHGWTVSADLNWFTAYEALGRRYRVLAIDHRGHGRGIRSRRRFRLADCADDVAALCEHLGIERVIPVGYSMGGPIALLTWHRHRDLVDGLVLCATAPYFRGSGPESTLFSMLPLVANAARLTPQALRHRVASRLLGTRTDDTDIGRWARAEIVRSDAAAVADAGASLGRFDARPWLHEIDVPTAVVRTLQDNAVPPHRQTMLAEHIPDAARRRRQRRPHGLRDGLGPLRARAAHRTAARDGGSHRVGQPADQHQPYSRTVLSQTR